MKTYQLLTPTEASKIYNIPEDELLLLAKTGKIGHYHLGKMKSIKMIRFDHDQILKYIDPLYLSDEEKRQVEEEKRLIEERQQEEIRQAEEEKRLIEERRQKEEERQREYEEDQALNDAYNEAINLFRYLRKSRYKDKLQELNDQICILRRSRKIIDKNEVVKLENKYCLLIAAKFNGIKKYKKFKSPLSKYYRKSQLIEYRINRTERILADYEIITTGDWIDICEHWGNKCLCCGRPGNYQSLTMDHIIPLALGGAHKKYNIQPLCRNCNSRKGAKYIDYRK